MVLHAAVEKPSTTLKALLLLLPVPLCSEMPSLTEGRVIEGSANKSNKHMLQILLSLLVQARCCLKRTPVRGYATVSDIFLHVCTGVYPGFDLYATGVPPAASRNARIHLIQDTNPTWVLSSPPPPYGYPPQPLPVGCRQLLSKTQMSEVSQEEIIA